MSECGMRPPRIHFAAMQGCRPRPPEEAFTLIELLIAVALIAVLAMIEVPDFLEAQTRAKNVKARNEIHTLAGALDAYWLDNRAYPPNQIRMRVVRPPVDEGEQPDPGIVWLHRLELAGGEWLCETTASRLLRSDGESLSHQYDAPLAYNGVGLVRLTTPVAYMGHLPADPYLHARFGYACRPPAIWIPSDVATSETWDLMSMRPYGYVDLTEFDPDGLSIPAFGRTVSYVLTSPGPDYEASFTHVSEHFPGLYDPTNGTVSQGDFVLPGRQ